MVRNPRLCGRSLSQDRSVQASTGTIPCDRICTTHAGVYTEVFAPTDGIAPSNAHRVLLDLHSGSFESGSRWTSHIESVPIDSVAKTKVISIDYRQRLNRAR